MACVHAGHTAGRAGLCDMRETQGCAWVPGVHLVSAAAGCVTVVTGASGHWDPEVYHRESTQCSKYREKRSGSGQQAMWVRRV